MTHNPNTQAIHNYIIVEDLVHAPCAMLVLEVLQSYPMQRKDLFSSIRRVDPLELSLITFEKNQVTYRLSHQVAFHIIV